MNTFGTLYRLTDFGESHGAALGGVIDGVPAGFPLDKEAVQSALDRRRPGSNRPTSQRREPDTVEWLSGISEEGLTLGTPIGFIVRNADGRSDDYLHLKNTFRPGHADYTTLRKYGLREHKGGGRSSGRQTLCRVVAGAIATQMLESEGIGLRAFVSGIGSCRMSDPYAVYPAADDISSSPVFCPDAASGNEMMQLLRHHTNDSVGGRVSLICRGVPVGLGSPVYHKLTARLAAAMMSINAARGFDYGLGFRSAEMFGRDAIDEYSEACLLDSDLQIFTADNRCGGMEGGISTGQDICLSVYFKPTPTRPYAVGSFTSSGNPAIIEPRGRHDQCVAIRAVPVVEAMGAMVILDELLMNRTTRF